MPTLTLRPEFDESFADFQAALTTALDLPLPKGALKRLGQLVESFRDFIVHGDARTAPGTNEVYLPLRLELPARDMDFLAALRARDIAAIGHLFASSG